MDYIIDRVAGSPSRNKVVNGNVCMRVDDLIFTGMDDFLSSFAREPKKSLQIGSLDENDVMFCRPKNPETRCRCHRASGSMHGRPP